MIMRVLAWPIFDSMWQLEQIIKHEIKTQKEIRECSVSLTLRRMDCKTKKEEEE